MSGEDERAESAMAEGESPEPPAKEDPELSRLRKELEAAKGRAEELLERLERTQADYENLQKRTDREISLVREVANEGLFASLLPVLDDFDHALAAMSEEARAGVQLLHDKLWHVLRDGGLEAESPLGGPFDPYNHEVVGRTDDADLEDGTVKEVVQKGYKYRRRLLRPAKVIVVKRGEPDGEDSGH